MTTLYYLTTNNTSKTAQSKTAAKSSHCFLRTNLQTNLQKNLTDKFNNTSKAAHSKSKLTDKFTIVFEWRRIQLPVKEAKSSLRLLRGQEISMATDEHRSCREHTSTQNWELNKRYKTKIRNGTYPVWTYQSQIWNRGWVANEKWRRRTHERARESFLVVSRSWCSNSLWITG